LTAAATGAFTAALAFVVCSAQLLATTVFVDAATARTAVVITWAAAAMSA